MSKDQGRTPRHFRKVFLDTDAGTTAADAWVAGLDQMNTVTNVTYTREKEGLVVELDALPPTRRKRT